MLWVDAVTAAAGLSVKCPGSGVGDGPLSSAPPARSNVVHLRRHQLQAAVVAQAGHDTPTKAQHAYLAGLQRVLPRDHLPYAPPANGVLALDAKMTFDTNALFRHPQVAELRDKSQEDPRESRAADRGLAYIGLSGNIGCIVNGAGLAMATMDTIKLAGGEPANFLDIGGGASAQVMADGLEIILGDAEVKARLVATTEEAVARVHVSPDDDAVAALDARPMDLDFLDETLGGDFFDNHASNKIYVLDHQLLPVYAMQEGV